MIPVAGNAIQIALCHQRRFREQIAALLLLILHKALQKLNHSRTLGKQHGQALANGLHRSEILQLTANFVVVALECFLLLFKVLLKLACLGEGHTIHAAQGIVFCVPAPVSARCVRQLHRLYCAGAHQVRPCAKVGVIPLRVYGKLPALLAVLLQQLQLVGLTCKQRAPFFQADYALLDGQIGFHDFFHLGFDGRELLRRERSRAAHVIIPAVFQRGADAEMRFRIKVLDRLCHNVGSRVPESVLALLISEGQNIHGAVLADSCTQIFCLTVNANGAGSLIKAHTDAFCDVSRGNARLKFLDNAIF